MTYLKPKSALIAAIAVISHSQAHSLTLNEARDKVTENHPQMLSKRLELDAAEKNVKASMWQLGPGVSITNSHNQYDQRLILTRIQQPLFMGGKIWYGIQESLAKREVANAELESTENDLKIKTSDAYLEVIRLKRKEEIARKNTAEHWRLLQLIKRKTDAGVNPLSEALTAEMRYQSAMAEHVQLKSQLATTLSQLEQLLGETVGNSNNLLPPKEITFNLSLEEAIQAATDFSPQLKSQKFKSEQAEARLGIDRSVLLPQIQLRQDRYSGSTPYPNTITYVSVEYQIGGGASSLYTVSASNSQQKSTQSQIESTQKDVTNSVTKDWNQFSMTKDQAKIISKQLSASEDVMASFLRQFSIGKRTWIDVLNTQKELSQTHYTLVDTEISLQQSRNRLLIQTGHWESSTNSQKK
jgi:adhesin transport system outer membrane protein